MRKRFTVTPRMPFPKARTWRDYFARWRDESGIAAVEFAVIAAGGSPTSHPCRVFTDGCSLVIAALTC